MPEPTAWWVSNEGRTDEGPLADREMMRCCHIVGSLERKYGGPSKSVYALAEMFGQCNYQVELLATDRYTFTENQEENLRVSVFYRNWPGRICPSGEMRTRLQHLDTDLIHHHGLWLRTLHYAHEHAVAKKIPLVISPRGMMSEWSWNHHRRRKAFARRFIHPGALEAAAGWHATSEGEAEEIRALGFTQPICVAPNGVTMPKDYETQAYRDYWYRRCPAARGGRNALFYGRFHEKKRVIELIDLWLEVAPADWMLLIVGIPETYTVRQLERYVLRASGTGRVKIFDGTDSPPPYAIASLFILPSRSESFGLTVAEAMTYAVPILVTDTTPWRDVRSILAGWWVPWESFGNALKEAFAESIPLLAARGCAGRRFVYQRYGWEVAAAKLDVFYRDLVADRGEATPISQA